MEPTWPRNGLHEGTRNGYNTSSGRVRSQGSEPEPVSPRTLLRWHADFFHVDTVFLRRLGFTGFNFMYSGPGQMAAMRRIARRCSPCCDPPADASLVRGTPKARRSGEPEAAGDRDRSRAHR
jgi:hypothetical protein